MIKKNYTTLRIILSMIAFFGGIYSIPYLNIYSQNLMVSQAFAYSIISFIVLFLNYNLFSLHFNRFLKQKDKILFCLVGFLAFSIVFAINIFFLKLPVIIVNYEVLSRYIIFGPFNIIILSFFYAISYILVYKLLTDRLKIKNGEIKIILISSVIFAMCLSFVSGFNMMTFDMDLYLKYFTFYTLLTLVISYLYNQTGNLFVSMMCMGSCLFVCHILVYFIY